MFVINPLSCRKNTWHSAIIAIDTGCCFALKGHRKIAVFEPTFVLWWKSICRDPGCQVCLGLFWQCWS